MILRDPSNPAYIFIPADIAGTIPRLYANESVDWGLLLAQTGHHFGSKARWRWDSLIAHLNIFSDRTFLLVSNLRRLFLVGKWNPDSRIPIDRR